MRRLLRILDLDVELSGPDAVVAPIAFGYRRFARAAGSARPEATVRLALTPAGVRVDDVLTPPLAGFDPRLQLYQALLNTVMGRLGDHLVLHAAALRCPDGGAMLLAAPSGHGKSSQTLELVRRGLALLSDDYAPLDPRSGAVWPYPRAVGVLPGGGARLPDALVRAAGADAPVLFGKRLVDVGLALGEVTVAHEPAPLTRVVLLTSGAAAERGGPTRIELAARLTDGDTIERRLGAIDGVRVLDTRTAPPLHWIAIELAAQRGAAARIESLLDGDEVVFFETFWSERPSFDVEPTATPVPRRLAAEHLGRELLNRRPGGRLLARHGQRLASLFVELAGALRDTPCVEVRVGRFDETADLLESIARGAYDGTGRFDRPGGANP